MARRKEIDLLRVIDLLQAPITPALCRTVFTEIGLLPFVDKIHQ